MIEPPDAPYLRIEVLQPDGAQLLAATIGLHSDAVPAVDSVDRCRDLEPNVAAAAIAARDAWRASL